MNLLGHGWELLIILLIVFLIFGARRMPELGEGLGKGIREFRKATQELTAPMAAAPPAPPAPAPETPAPTASPAPAASPAPGGDPAPASAPPAPPPAPPASGSPA
ncbi:MAG: twin-arginine translocase TatA/TatE family subunit [Candidatus Dormibacteria bacterium]